MEIGELMLAKFPDNNLCLLPSDWYIRGVEGEGGSEET